MKEYNSSDILSKVTETSLLSDGHHTKAGPRVDIQKYPKPYPTPPHKKSKRKPPILLQTDMISVPFVSESTKTRFYGVSHI